MNLRIRSANIISVLTVIASFALWTGGGYANDSNAIGVIRWDAWFPGSPWANSVRSTAWKERLPFYTTNSNNINIVINELSQSVVDKEKLYAAAAGIDYFIYGLYLDSTDEGVINPIMARFNQAIELFAKSRNDDIKFSVYLPHPLKIETSKRLHELLYDYMKNRNFLRTKEGMPVVFWLLQGGQAWIKSIGGIEAARTSLQKFRSDVQANIGKSPYVIAMTFAPSDGPVLVTSVGFNAISSYGNPLGARSADRPTGARPYSRCLAASRYYWAIARGNRVPFLPPLSLGWDYRPAIAEEGRGKDPEWCEFPSTQEVKEAVLEGLRSAPDSAFKSIVIYAWNEFSEGGILEPTLCSGAERLKGLAEATGRSGELENALKKLPLPVSPLVCESDRRP